jgi:hypothetical protein
MMNLMALNFEICDVLMRTNILVNYAKLNDRMIGQIFFVQYQSIYIPLNLSFDVRI